MLTDVSTFVIDADADMHKLGAMVILINNFIHFSATRFNEAEREEKTKWNIF